MDNTTDTKKEYRYIKSYRNYRNARNAAWDILIEDGIRSLPIPIYDICEERGILIKDCDSLDTDGIAQIIAGEPVIMLSGKIKDKGRRNFTIAHELGHIILMHKDKYDLVQSDPKDPDCNIEVNANIFAARLLAPACVLWGCNARTPEQIMALCCIGKDTARLRARRMEELYSRGKFLTSEKEEQVYCQFLAFMDENRF